MKPTERVNTMLSLCRAVLGGDTPSLDELSQESAAELYALSHHHDLAHLVSCALFRAGGWTSQARSEPNSKSHR